MKRGLHSIKTLYHTIKNKISSDLMKKVRFAGLMQSLGITDEAYMSPESLFEFIKNGAISYEVIESMDPQRFHDLEQNMRLLFDHSAINLGLKSQPSEALEKRLFFETVLSRFGKKPITKAH